MEEARPARPEDLAAVVVLAEQARAELAEERGGRLLVQREVLAPPLGPAFEGLLQAADAALVVGTFDEVVVGYGLVRLETLRDGSTLARLTEIYVDPPARGVGVGEELMAAVLDWATARGATGLDAVVLPGMREAKNYFERAGLTARMLVVHRALVTDEAPDRALDERQGGERDART